MIRNPFEAFLEKNIEDIKEEDVDGAFTCQEEDCWHTVGTAKYIDSESLLSWICPDGHISKIEGYHLD